MVDIWRYSSKNNKNSSISVMKCRMYERDPGNGQNRFSFYRRVEIERDGHRFIEHVPYEEGSIKQGVLWLNKRDDQRAIELFRKNALKRIDDLERLIEGRKRFIRDVHVKEDKNAN